MDEAKMYNVCLQRVKFQVVNAKQRLNEGLPAQGRYVLESYCSGDVEELIDTLEIYDIEDRSREGLNEKLDDLAYTVSLLVKEKVCFDYDEKGDLCLFVIIGGRAGEPLYEAEKAALSAA
jgi:hypothetical protein